MSHKDRDLLAITTFGNTFGCKGARKILQRYIFYGIWTLFITLDDFRELRGAIKWNVRLINSTNWFMSLWRKKKNFPNFIARENSIGDKMENWIDLYTHKYITLARVYCESTPRIVYKFPFFCHRKVKSSSSEKMKNTLGNYTFGKVLTE